jgi:hypothetical protein
MDGSSNGKLRKEAGSSNQRKRRRSQKRSANGERCEPRTEIGVSSVNDRRRGTIKVVKVKSVRCYFTSAALQRALLRGPGLSPQAVGANGVFAWTKNGIFRTGFHSLQEVQRCIEEKHAVRVNHSILANSSRIKRLDLSQKQKEAVFHVGPRSPHGADYYIRLSRRGARLLKRIFEIGR